ncbi:MAG TPA: hypothetical protein VE198_09485 [Actinoallomurus sp.]|nr:hypothetical protein [Actinoallomurus sp.]
MTRRDGDRFLVQEGARIARERAAKEKAEEEAQRAESEAAIARLRAKNPRSFYR